MAFTQIAVTGTYQLADGTAVDGSVTFTPTATMRNGAGESETTVSAAVVAAIVGGVMTGSLAATDDTGTTPVGVTYRVEVRSHRHPGLVEGPFWIEVPFDGGAIDLDTVPALDVPPSAIPYLTRTEADGVYAPLADEVAVTYAASFTPSTSTGVSQAMTCTGDVAVQVPTGPTVPVLHLAFVASGAERDVTFTAGIRTSSGLTRGPHTVPAGEGLLAALRWSGLLSDWVLVALTVTAA